MTPTWTGNAGEPVPAILRHDLTPCGERQRRCTRCERCWWLDELPDPMALCPSAVAQRLSELEAHEASIHKAVARSRRGIVRWLRRDLDRMLADTQNRRLTDGRVLYLQGQREALALAADAISAGRDAEWCEANPETSPAPVGADAGRDPGSKDSR